MANLHVDLSGAEVVELRRLFNRLSDRNGKPMDLIRSRAIDKMRRAITALEARRDVPADPAFVLRV